MKIISRYEMLYTVIGKPMPERLATPLDFCLYTNGLKKEQGA